MKSRILFLLFAALFIASCTPDEEKKMDIDINYKLRYGGQPLVMFADYTYPTGEDMFFSRYSMYVSDVELVHSNGSTILEEVDFINFTTVNSTDAGAEEGIIKSYTKLDKYENPQLRFTIGVNQVNNAKTPADFTSDNPLSLAAEYWPGWTSYIFSRTEGQIKINGDNKGFSLHTGSDEAALTFLVDLGDDFDQADKRTIELFLDIESYFGKDKTVYDIAANPQIHSLSQQPQVMELVNNLSSSIKVNIK